MSTYFITQALQAERKVIFRMNKQLIYKENNCGWSARQEGNVRDILRRSREIIYNDLPILERLLTEFKGSAKQRPENAFAKLELHWKNLREKINLFKENAREFLGSKEKYATRRDKSVKKTRSNASCLVQSFSNLEIRQPRPLTAHPAGSSRIARPKTAGHLRGESTQEALAHSLPGSGCFKKANSPRRRLAPAPAAAAVAGCSGTSKAPRSTAAIRSTRPQTSALPKTTNENPKTEANKPSHSFLRRKSQRYVLKKKTSNFLSSLSEPQDQSPLGGLEKNS